MPQDARVRALSQHLVDRQAGSAEKGSVAIRTVVSSVSTLKAASAIDVSLLPRRAAPRRRPCVHVLCFL